MNLKRYDIRKLNISLILVVLMLTIVGIITLKLVDPTLLKKQLVGSIICIVVCAFVATVDYHTICGLSLYWYILGVILLILVQVPGVGVSLNEATRWIEIGPIQIQPSEMAKVILIIFLAQFFTLFRENISNYKFIGIAILLAGLPIMLIFIQPDLSSSLVLVFFFTIMLYSAGISYKIVTPFILTAIPVGILGVWFLLQPSTKILEDYQKNRILGLFNPEEYPNIMYQQNKSVNMIANGKLYGILDGGSAEDLTSRKLPIVESDFIFAAVSESYGFIGTGVVMLLLFSLVVLCFNTARKAKDYTGKLICIGVSAMFMFQIFANIGVVTRILPNTGLPLPFISYGISALLSYFVAIGIVINIGLQGKTN